MIDIGTYIIVLFVCFGSGTYLMWPCDEWLQWNSRHFSTFYHWINAYYFVWPIPLSWVQSSSCPSWDTNGNLVTCNLSMSLCPDDYHPVAIDHINNHRRQLKWYSHNSWVTWPHTVHSMSMLGQEIVFNGYCCWLKMCVIVNENEKIILGIFA